MTRSAFSACCPCAIFCRSSSKTRAARPNRSRRSSPPTARADERRPGFKAQSRERRIASMGLTYVTVALKRVGASDGAYEALFLVDTGATDSMAPSSKLVAAGIVPAGKTTYELADGSLQEYTFGLAQIEFMGEVTAGRVIFGP